MDPKNAKKCANASTMVWYYSTKWEKVNAQHVVLVGLQSTATRAIFQTLIFVSPECPFLDNFCTYRCIPYWTHMVFV